jgi:PhnB protein
MTISVSTMSFGRTRSGSTRREPGFLRPRRLSEAIAFYKSALGAEEVLRMEDPGGKVHHAEIKIGDSRIMLADEHPEPQALSPKTVGGSPVSIHLYVEDVDAVVSRAVAAGAKLVRPVADQFYGDRVGGIEDPFGYRWFIATHKEDLSIEEIRRRSETQGRQRFNWSDPGAT